MNITSVLKKIIKTLSQNEKKQLLDEHVSVKNLGRQSKTLMLIKLLIEEKEYSDNEIQNKIYGKVSYLAFNKLCSRLKDNILELIIKDSAIENSNYSDRNKQLFLLRKKSLQVEVLHLKGLNENIISMYNSITNKAKEYEFYDIQLQTLNSKIKILGAFGRNSEIKELQEEIKIVEHQLITFNNSQAIYQKVINKISFHSATKNYESLLLESIKLLQLNVESTNSKIIKYYLLNLEVEKCQIDKNYISANNHLLELKDLLKLSKSIYTKNRYASLIVNLANNYLLLNELEEAINYANNSKILLSENEIALKLVDEILFYSNFYLGNFKGINQYLDFDSSFRRNETNEVIYQKFNFYKANMHFIQKEYLECISILENHSEIDRDKEGWNIWKRILLLLAKIECGEIDSIDLTIANLVQFFKRNSKLKDVNPRYRLIIKICINLINDDLNPQTIQKKHKKYVKNYELLLLPKYQWQPKSPELIIFENWFLHKFSFLRNYIDSSSTEYLKKKLVGESNFPN